MTATFMDNNLKDTVGLSTRISYSTPTVANVFHPQVGYPNDRPLGLYQDQLLKNLGFEVPFPGLDARFVLGWSMLNPAQTILYGDPVIEKSLSPNEDWRYYGSLLSGFRPGASRSSNPVRAIEHDCTHVNLLGSLSTSSGGWDLYPQRASVQRIVGPALAGLTSVGSPRPYSSGRDYAYFGVTSLGGGDYSFAVSSSLYGSASGTRVRMEEVLFLLKRDLGGDWVSSARFTAGRDTMVISYRAFDYRLVHTSATVAEIQISYDFRCQTYGTANNTVSDHTYNVSHSISCWLTNSTVPSIQGPGSKPIWLSLGSISSSSQFTLVDDQGIYIPEDYRWPTASTTMTGRWSTSTAHFMSTGGPAGENFDLAGITYDALRKQRRVLTMFKMCESIHWQDMRSAAAISSGKALGSLDSSSNYLEAFSELPEILSLIPNIASLPAIIKKIGQKDLTAIPDLVKALADEFLRYNYGIRPTIADVREATRLANDSVRLLHESLSDGLVLYGSHTVTVPADIVHSWMGEGSLRVTVRSKVVLQGGFSSALLVFLKLKSVGLNLGPSGFWQLIRFSFVADWFTNVGQRMETAEQNAALLALPVKYYVHSYTYDFTYNQFELLQKGLRTSRGDEFTIRFFKRTVSFHHPVLGRDGRFDLQPPPSLPRYAASLGCLIVASLG